jgi:hypothetical protein
MRLPSNGLNARAAAQTLLTKELDYELQVGYSDFCNPQRPIPDSVEARSRAFFRPPPILFAGDSKP